MTGRPRYHHCGSFGALGCPVVGVQNCRLHAVVDSDTAAIQRSLQPSYDVFVATTEDQVRERRKSIARRLGRNAAERATALRRLAATLHLSEFELYAQLDAWPETRTAQYFFKRAQELTARPRQKPGGHDDLWEFWLEGLSPTALDLALAAGEMGLSWCAADIDPFLISTTSEWLERICGTGSILLPHLESPTRRVSRFVHRDFEVVLLIEHADVCAWVGRLGFGAAVEFGRESLTFRGRNQSPAFRTAAGLAVAWYLDLCLPRQRGIPGVTSLAAGEWLDIGRYQPAGTAFDNQVSAIAADRVPAHAHWVVSHIRHLRDRNPSDEKVATAPAHLRDLMGPDDTWVAGHQREGSNVHALLNHLAKRAALADAVGTAFWKA